MFFFIKKNGGPVLHRTEVGPPKANQRSTEGKPKVKQRQAKANRRKAKANKSQPGAIQKNKASSNTFLGQFSKLSMFYETGAARREKRGWAPRVLQKMGGRPLF